MRSLPIAAVVFFLLAACQSLPVATTYTLPIQNKQWRPHALTVLLKQEWTPLPNFAPDIIEAERKLENGAQLRIRLTQTNRQLELNCIEETAAPQTKQPPAGRLSHAANDALKTLHLAFTQSLPTPTSTDP